MLLPKLNQKEDMYSLTNQFLGLNKNLQIQDNEFSNMKNITNDHFPVLTQRDKRGLLGTIEKPQGCLGGRYMSYVSDNKLYYNETFVCDLEKTDADRQLVMMGAYLCVFPDGVIYNTYDFTLETIKNQVTAENVKITLSKYDGTAYDSSNTVVGKTEPSDKSKYWLDTSTDTAVMKMYQQSTSMWVSVPTVYVKFSAPNIGKGFNPYDAVSFSGVDKGDWIYNGYDFNQNNIVYDCGDDYLVVVGLINMEHTNTSPIIFERIMPEMDYVCELDNRIWGCSSANHEIYASKLGDPKNWYFYAGLDSDSYAVTVGSENDFTGAVSFGGYVYFFKEGGYHKVYGSKPSNYEISWKQGRGVQQGSSRSVVVANDYLFYKARDGIYMFDGSSTKISEKLGVETYYEAVGGAYRDKYYVSMRDSHYKYSLYVYDINKGTWVQEDDIVVRYFATTTSCLYILTKDGDAFIVNSEEIYTYNFPKTNLGDKFLYPNDELYPGRSAEGDSEGRVEWSFETGDLGINSPFQKYVKRTILRMWLDSESKMRVEISYDSTGEWQNLFEYYCTRKRSYEVPLQVARCDHFKLRFSGYGAFKLFSITNAIEGGTSASGNI